jgi:dethiobiotin synthetase
VASHLSRRWSCPRSARTFFVTGTDTGVGKTVLTCLLAQHGRQSGCTVAALKPLCSGGRADAHALLAAAGANLSLDAINPWHFPAPLAPRLAARRVGRRVALAAVLRQIRQTAAGFDLVLVEGAGGLLSPLGEDFNARDLIIALRARPIVVCPNRLGAVNQALLVRAALPAAAARQARVVLMAVPSPDASCRSNAQLLTEEIGVHRVHELPRLSPGVWRGHAPLPANVRRTLHALLADD